MKVFETLLVVFVVREILGIPTSNKKMVLFTNKLSWNSASLVCNVTGGSLLSIKDEQERLVVKAFLKTSPWKEETGFQNFWTGIHIEVGSNPEKSYQGDCSGPTTFFTSYSSGRNCVIIKTSIFSPGKLDDYECYKYKKYICEYIGGQCSYGFLKNTKAVDPNPFYLTTSDNAGCTDACSTGLLGGLECWAATWHEDTRQCSLHFTADMEYYDDKKNQDDATGYSLHTKSCYTATIDDTHFDGYSIDSQDAIETCAGPSSQGDGKVYTLFTQPKTWQDARDTCHGLGYELLVADNAQHYRFLVVLFGQSVPKFWIGLSGKKLNFVWITGQAVTWDVWANEEPRNYPEEMCVNSVTSLSYTWTTANCTEELPYICQLSNASCVYESLEDTRSPDNNLKSLDLEECQAECKSDQDCKGFSHKHVVFGSDKCYIHSSQDALYLFDANNLVTDSGWKLYRWSCVFGVTNGFLPLKYDPGPLVAGNNVTEESPPQSSSPLVQTTEYISPSSTTVFFTEYDSCLDSTTTPSIDMSTSQTVVESAFSETSTTTLPSSSVVMEESLGYTSESVFSTSVIYSTTASTNMQCPCKCNKNYTKQETDQLIQEIQESLFVEPTSTSKSIMSKKSAEDPRPSAQTVGYIAITFMTITFGGLILMDMPTLFHHVKMGIQRLYRVLNSYRESPDI